MRLLQGSAILLLLAVPFAFAEAASSNSIASNSNTDAAEAKALAGSKIGGEVSGFLKSENSPYIVEQTLVLNEGKALAIEAGTVIEFNEGTGIDVRGGSIAVVGEKDQKVVLKSTEPAKHWNGISITGDHRAVFQNVVIENAELGVAVENGSADFESVRFNHCSQMGLYARAATVNVTWSEFGFNSGVAAWAANNSFLTIENSQLHNNNVALMVSSSAVVNLQSATIAHNEYGLVDMEPSHVKQQQSTLEQNAVGIVANDLPSADLRKISKNNQKNFSKNVGVAMANLPDEPLNLSAKSYAASEPAKLPGLEGWSVEGNVGLTMGYHGVLMRHNGEPEDYVMGTDTVKRGDEYINYFQVPGLFANLNAYLMMESSDGKTVEFSTDLMSDTWNHFKVDNVLAVYSDKFQRISLGDVYLSGGEIYMAGINSFGASYDLNVLKNRVGDPLFSVSAFAGETQKPKSLGDRNEDIYKDYIDDGEVVPQEMVAGGKIRWNMHHRFNGTLGFIGGRDYVEDPYLRDGLSPDWNTAEPVVSSNTFFADGNWLVFPGDIELNGQIAVGAADTSNAQMQRAVNKVFVDAGVDASNFTKLRRLMANPNLVNQLHTAELEEFFGDYSMMTKSEMREKLKSLLASAKKVYEEYKNVEDDPSDVGDWDGQNVAFMGSLRWDLGNTVLSGHLRFVGSKYYSAGSPDLLQNSREAFGNLDQKIFDFWTMNVSYRLNVENASHGTAYNFCGLAEGSKLGLVPGADQNWLDEHEQDENRTLHEHDFVFSNNFKVNSMLNVSVGYKLNYRTRSTNQRLYGDFSGLSGIYEDPWFEASEERSFINLMVNDDTLKVDSARWAEYYALSDEDYLASQFTEKFLRQTVSLDLKLNLPKNVLKIGGEWTFRDDMSEFENDDLISGFDFKDETFGILGYYFHGADYFEQRYPVSLTTTMEKFKNTFAITPRYKVYNRDEMTDFELTLSDDFTMPIVKNFMDLILMAGFREETVSRDEGDKTLEESEIDVSGSATVKINHTDRLTTEWTLGTYCSYRPDYRSDEYKDIYGIASVNYSF